MASRTSLSIALFLYSLLGYTQNNPRENIIGIETALISESSQILELIKPYQTKKKYGVIYYSGKFRDYPIVLVHTGIGKVNAAAVTANLINQYHPRFILFFGTAGKLKGKLKLGEVVIGNQVYELEHVFARPNEKRKRNPNDKKPYTPLLTPDSELLSLANKITESIDKYTNGLIATTDIYPETKQTIAAGLSVDAKAIAMEDFAVISTCQLMGTKCLTIRCITDSPDAILHMKDPLQYHIKKKNKQNASMYLAKFFQEIMQAYDNEVSLP